LAWDRTVEQDSPDIESVKPNILAPRETQEERGDAGDHSCRKTRSADRGNPAARDSNGKVFAGGEQSILPVRLTPVAQFQWAASEIHGANGENRLDCRRHMQTWTSVVASGSN
jgi:hypothetical protein